MAPQEASPSGSPVPSPSAAASHRTGASPSLHEAGIAPRWAVRSGTTSSPALRARLCRAVEIPRPPIISGSSTATLRRYTCGIAAHSQAAPSRRTGHRDPLKGPSSPTPPCRVRRASSGGRRAAQPVSPPAPRSSWSSPLDEDDLARWLPQSRRGLAGPVNIPVPGRPRPLCWLRLPPPLTRRVPRSARGPGRGRLGADKNVRSGAPPSGLSCIMAGPPRPTAAS